jgi:glyoxylase-like metal-dependent hydrolase (beta-lactamase superfamily II)
MTGAGNNTYLLAADGDGAALIDAGVGNSGHLAELRNALDAHHARLDQVLVTHGHADHASGAPAIARAHPSAQFLKYPWPGPGEWGPGRDGPGGRGPRSEHDEDDQYVVHWQAIADGDELDAGGERLVVVATPGHSPDHLAFWHERSRTMFTGDLVALGTSVMIHSSRGGILADYMRSLERVLAFQPRVLLPAHGPRVDDPRALIVGYLDHRRQREQQVIAALQAGHATVEAIAESIYHDVDVALMPAARENVRAHLEKLRAEGRAFVAGGLWRA